MASAFDQCQLWPINHEEYAKFVSNANAKLSQLKVSQMRASGTYPKHMKTVTII
jgi:hypothetical protein